MVGTLGYQMEYYPGGYNFFARTELDHYSSIARKLYRKDNPAHQVYPSIAGFLEVKGENLFVCHGCPIGKIHFDGGCAVKKRKVGHTGSSITENTNRLPRSITTLGGGLLKDVTSGLSHA